MKTIKLLENYKRNKQLEQILDTQISEMLKKGSESGVASDTILDYRFDPDGRPKHITGFNEREYNRKRKKLRNIRRDIRRTEEWVAAIDDDLTRIVFESRYLQGWSWAKIANSLGYAGNEDYPRKAIKDKYLIEIGLK